MKKIETQPLDEEVSFKLYTLSRLIQQTYQVFLAPLGLTYVQYLVMKILLEKDGIAVNVISSRLVLASNTVTPLLQRMEKQGLLERKLMCRDQRQRIILLTDKGRAMRRQIAEVSVLVATSLSELKMNCVMANQLKDQLNDFIQKII